MPKHVVIVGAGFGGLSAAKGLGGTEFSVTVIDRANHHLFQPLLYQVATAMLSPADIAVPVRHVLAKYQNIQVKMLEVTGVDLASREVVCGLYREPFDILVLATGASSYYYGKPWETRSPSLKTLQDALEIRVKILRAFEEAELESDPVRRQKLLTFVIIGGGPTGVELAGAIAELAHHTVSKDFRKIESRRSRIILIEAGARVLPTFSEKSSKTAHRSLSDLGVEIYLGQRVMDIGENLVCLEGGITIEAETIVWAAGVRATPVAQWLAIEPDRSGRVSVGNDLSIANHPEIFVIGDASRCMGEQGEPLQGVAPVAMQQGRYVARKIQGESGPFCYHDKGSLATIGHKRAVAEFGKLNLTGTIAWLAWTIVHIYYLIGFRNRIVVLLEWAWAYFTRERGARLISYQDKRVSSGDV